MGRYLLIESRDPFESREVSYFYGLAGDLAARGEKVTLFLVQNGALAARKGARENPLAGVLAKGVEVLADSFSLRERAVHSSDRIPAVKQAEIDELVDRMMAEDGTKVLWH